MDTKSLIGEANDKPYFTEIGQNTCKMEIMGSKLSLVVGI